MIKLIDLLKEAKDKYEYGCAMLYFSFPGQIIKLQDAINSDDLYVADDNGGYGLETEAHCTLLYGLHEEVTLDEVKNILNKFKFGELKATGPSLFKNEKFDVLKYDIGYPTKEGAFLHKCNHELNKLPNTQNFPDYHPHATIAYIKPGLGKKYVQLFKDKGVSEFIAIPTHAVYSQPDGTKTKIKINA
jgi:2'-5' RNA ligase